MGTTLPKAVFLDVGWTLVYPRESLWESLEHTIGNAGARLSSGDAEKMVYKLMATHRKKAVEAFEAGAEYTDSDEKFKALFEAMGGFVFGQVGLNGDYAELTTLFLERFWEQDNWVIFPEVIEALKRLKDCGCCVGALSNASSALVDFMDRIGLLSHLDFTVVSAIEGTKKPDSRIFQRALEKAGVSPTEAVHVGDMFLEDILGARKAGIRPFLMDRGPLGMFPHFPESAEHPPGSVEIVHSLDDVLAVIGPAADG